MHFTTFNSATVTNCTFNRGTQTVDANAKGGSNVCVTQARLSAYGGSAAYMDGYTTVSVSESRCVPGWRVHHAMWLSRMLSGRAVTGCCACSFIGNYGPSQSGVLGLISGFTNSIVGCNFTANTGPDGTGCGVFAYGQTSLFTVANSTFVGNSGEYTASSLT